VKSKLFQYLWAIERVASLCSIDKFGDHDWYAEGAKVILAAQEPTGAWAKGEPNDISLAVLFLRRATRPLNER
jgi:hypothetical protein